VFFLENFQKILKKFAKIGGYPPPIIENFLKTFKKFSKKFSTPPNFCHFGTPLFEADLNQETDEAISELNEAENDATTTSEEFNQIKTEVEDRMFEEELTGMVVNYCDKRNQDVKIAQGITSRTGHPVGLGIQCDWYPVRLGIL